MEVKYSFFEYDQKKLYYGIVGEGFPVLLLHGWPQTSFMWRHLYPYLVKNRFKVIMPDLPGLGKSSAPKSCLLYTSPSPRDTAISRMPSSA